MRFFIFISLSFIISNTNLVASEKLFPNYITDVDGNELSFSGLAENKTVCLITLKSINCPICLEQLKRFKEKKENETDKKQRKWKNELKRRE